MAQFRAVIKGQRGEASRLGSKSSGLNVKANGWTSGIQVIATYRDGIGDCFEIWETGGSLKTRPDRLIATLFDNGESVELVDFC